MHLENLEFFVSKHLIMNILFNLIILKIINNKYQYAE